MMYVVFDFRNDIEYQEFLNNYNVIVKDSDGKVIINYQGDVNEIIDKYNIVIYEVYDYIKGEADGNYYYFDGITFDLSEIANRWMDDTDVKRHINLLPEYVECISSECNKIVNIYLIMAIDDKIREMQDSFNMISKDNIRWN